MLELHQLHGKAFSVCHGLGLAGPTISPSCIIMNILNISKNQRLFKDLLCTCHPASIAICPWWVLPSTPSTPLHTYCVILKHISGIILSLKIFQYASLKDKDPCKNRTMISLSHLKQWFPNQVSPNFSHCLKYFFIWIRNQIKHILQLVTLVFKSLLMYRFALHVFSFPYNWFVETTGSFCLLGFPTVWISLITFLR